MHSGESEASVGESLPVRGAAAGGGWRGTLSRILPRTIQAMQRAFGSDPSTLEIAVGPGVRTCCSEVGSEVADLFETEYPGCCSAADPSGKSHLDLAKVLDIQMTFSGILLHHRHDLAACTCCKRDEFFLIVQKALQRAE